MAFYGSGIFYGSGSFYIGAATTAAQGIPIDLRFYRTSQDGIYVFWWGFDPAFITPTLISAGFDLELDTVPTFDSPNLVTFTQLTAITFQNGNVRKGFAVPVAARINATIQTWYARVRTHIPSFISAWSWTFRRANRLPPPTNRRMLMSAIQICGSLRICMVINSIKFIMLTF